MPLNICRVGVRRMGPDSLQWCPAPGQGATGTNWSRGSSSWTRGRTSLWGWQSPGPGCPEGLWSLLLWRYSRPGWTRCCAACCRWPCSSRVVGLDDPPRSLPTPTILWFCDSVTVCIMLVNLDGAWSLHCLLPASVESTDVLQNGQWCQRHPLRGSPTHLIWFILSQYNGLLKIMLFLSPLLRNATSCIF